MKTISDINQITDMKNLLSTKEELKNLVVKQTLTWQERMELYRLIQVINDKINYYENLAEK